MDKIKITNHQLFSLTLCGTIGGSLLLISPAMAGIAKQDAWISALIAPVYGIAVIWLYCFLASKYPDKTLIGVIKSILGKWLGTIICINFIFSFFSTSSHIPWYIGNFITIEVMPETPMYVINLLFVAAFVIASLYGLETYARASEVFTFLFLVIFFMAMLFVSPNIQIQNLQPIFEHGLIPIVKSSVFMSCFTTFPMITLIMIYPVNLDNIHEAKKSIFKGYILGCIILCITILMSILVFGSAIVAKTQFPTYMLGKEISIGTIITRIEFLFGAIWFSTQFTLEVIFFNACVKGISELLGLKNHKLIILPLGFVEFLISMSSFPDSIYQANWTRVAYIPYTITNGLIIPVLLLIVYLVKKCIFKAGVKNE